MHVLTLRDGCFPDGLSATYGGDNAADRPRAIEWLRIERGPAAFYTDICIKEARKGERAVAWLLEPPAVKEKSSHYDDAERKRDSFRAALTYRADLLTDRYYRFYPLGGSWVSPNYHGVHSKSLLCSLIASSKSYAPGHKLRHDIAFTHSGALDLYGYGYTPVQSKTTALVPYAFSVVVESWRGDYYFSEKLIDALSVGTVPVYWGCPDIGGFFDERGILSFETLDELSDILSDISLRKYKSMLRAVTDNAETAKRYMCAEDWIANAYPDLLRGEP